MSVGYNPAIVTDNLAFVMDAANPRCYPGSGTVMYDGVTRNNLTIANSPVYTSTDIKCWTFDGVDDYMYNFSASNPLTGNAATVILWINPDATQPDASYSGMFALGTKGCALGSGNGQTLLFSMTSNRTLTMAKWCDDSFSSIAPAASTWSQVSLVKDGAATRFGVNTSFQNASNTGTQAFAGSSFTIGCTDNPGRFFAGKMAICLLYNQALSDDQITQIYTTYRGRFGI
jgi:hypothetical protein